MIESHELKNRDRYLKKLIGFQDTEPVKVITGIRRCGKSSLLKLMIRHLRETGIGQEQIVEMNFESHDFRRYTSDEVYHYVKDRAVPGKRMYLFFDELQRIDAWEDAFHSFRVDLDCDIYITGSNAYLLSSEYSTYLSGRCVEIKMLPLSFREFLDFHNFEVRETSSALGGTRRQVFDQNGERYDLREVFAAYLRFGGMPGIADVGLDQEKALSLLEGIYSTVVVRDILEREKAPRPAADYRLRPSAENRPVPCGQHRQQRLRLLHRQHADERGAAGGWQAQRNPPAPTRCRPMSGQLLESYFFYEIKRFDIKGKEYLRTLGKYYIVDMGLRNFLLGFRNRDSGQAIENVVYFELLRRGYDVAIGKIDNQEVDFIATTADDKLYIQVTESMQSEEVRNRELSPLQKIRDNYEKVVLSLEPGLDTSYDGIKSLNLVDWLLGG